MAISIPNVTFHPEANQSFAIDVNPEEYARARLVDSQIPTIYEQARSAAEQSALNLENIQNARAERENQRQLLDLEKKKVQIAMDESELKGQLQSSQRKMMELILNEHIKNKQKSLDSHETVAQEEEAKHSNILQQNVGMLTALLKSGQGQLRAPTPSVAPSVAPSIPIGGAVDMPITTAVNDMFDAGIDPNQMFGFDANTFKKPSESKSVSISEDEIERKAQAIIDGRMAPSQLPKFGGAASIFNKVIDRVFALDPSFDIALADKEFSGGKQATQQLMKQQTLTSAFERTAQKNANVLEMLAKQVNFLGKSPILNEVKVNFNNQFVQDRNTAMAITALKTFTSEYAKVMTGQTTGAAVSDASRRETEELLKLTDNPEAFIGRLAVMRQDMANRMNSFDEELGRLRGKPYEGTRGTEQLEAVSGGNEKDPLGIL